MLPSKFLSVQVFSYSIVAIILLLGYSFVPKDFLNINKDHTIHILDQEASATILDIKHQEKSELLKGSILDFEGIYISYKFQAEEKVYQKTELIKKSERNLSDFVKSFEQHSPVSPKLTVRYNSTDPRQSAIDFSQVIASF